MTHECFYRGCLEQVGHDHYHCPRHEAILERRRAIIADRARARAAEKHRARSGRAEENAR